MNFDFQHTEDLDSHKSDSLEAERTAANMAEHKSVLEQLAALAH